MNKPARSPYEQGRLDMCREIIADLDMRIGTLDESIAKAKHSKANRISLQILRRAFVVARDNYRAKL